MCCNCKFYNYDGYCQVCDCKVSRTGSDCEYYEDR